MSVTPVIVNTDTGKEVRQMSEHDARPCIEGCGLSAEDGDVYCAGCRSGADQGDGAVTVGGIAHEDGLT